MELLTVRVPSRCGGSNIVLILWIYTEAEYFSFKVYHLNMRGFALPGESGVSACFKWSCIKGY